MAGTSCPPEHRTRATSGCCSTADVGPRGVSCKQAESCKRGASTSSRQRNCGRVALPALRAAPACGRCDACNGAPNAAALPAGPAPPRCRSRSASTRSSNRSDSSTTVSKRVETSSMLPAGTAVLQPPVTPCCSTKPCIMPVSRVPMPAMAA